MSLEILESKKLHNSKNSFIMKQFVITIIGLGVVKLYAETKYHAKQIAYARYSHKEQDMSKYLC
jgi:hypothetical protein